MIVLGFMAIALLQAEIADISDLDRSAIFMNSFKSAKASKDLKYTVSEVHFSLETIITPDSPITEKFESLKKFFSACTIPSPLEFKGNYYFMLICPKDISHSYGQVAVTVKLDQHKVTGVAVKTGLRIVSVPGRIQ